MKPRALLRFLPACAAGLLSGWLASRWIPRSTLTETPRIAFAGVSGTVQGADPAWNAMLAARTAVLLPGSAGDALEHLRTVDRENSRSPMRADFLKEDYILSLSADGLLDLLERGKDLTESQMIAAFTRLSELDPAQAFKAALRSERERRLDFLPNAVCKAWVHQDAEAAFKAVQEMPA